MVRGDYQVVSSALSRGGNVRVVIDADRCQGHGRCFNLAPDVFGFDELGNGVVLVAEPADERTQRLANLAAVNCPEHAISVDG